MWVNVSRTCELACKTTIRVSWMKHYSLSLSLSLSPLYPSLSFPRQSEWRFLRNLYCKSTDMGGSDLGNGSRAEDQSFFSETLVETLTKVLLSGRNQFYSLNFISTVRRMGFCLNRITFIISLLSLELTKNCRFVSGTFV